MKRSEQSLSEKTGGTEKHHNEPVSPEQPSLRSNFLVGSAQDLGHRYEHNEDSMLSFSAKLISENLKVDFGCFCVADGMGGYSGGELASALAVQKMIEKVLRKIYIPRISPEGSFTQEPVLEVLEDAMMSIHQEISDTMDGGGTTLTVAVLMDEYLTVAHIGDSRAYCISAAGEIEKITEDQTLVQRLVNLGQLTEDEARTYPQRNVLYYALGRGERIEPFLFTRKQPHNSYIILCTDGLWEVVPDQEIARVVMNFADPECIAKELVKLAESKGAMDNVTVLAVKI
jgi:protein phosphatase